MDTLERLDGFRAGALERMEKRDRQVKLATAGAAAVEALLLMAFVALADFGNRTHLLLLIATVLVYSTLAMALVALAAHVSRASERVLLAVELVAAERRAPR